MSDFGADPATRLSAGACSTSPPSGECPGEGEFITVPLNPTEAQWDGLARAIMMWLDMHPKTPRALFRHLKSIGRDVPDWLREEGELKALDHVPSKGTRCAIIYRAMLEDYRASLAPTETGTADTGNTESVRSMRAGKAPK